MKRQTLKNILLFQFIANPYINSPTYLPLVSNETFFKVGYQVMQQFIDNHPEMSVEEWTKLETEKIMEGSEVELGE
jgi:uncharacterized protein YjaZ